MKLCSTMQFRGGSLALLLATSLLLGACSEKKSETGKEEAPAVESGVAMAAIAPDAAKAAGIETAVSGPAEIRETLTVYGSIKPNAEREQTLRPRYAGIVKSVSKRPGDRVTQGESLLTIESSESLHSYTIVSPIEGQVLDRRANPGEAVGNDTVLMRVADLSSVWGEFALFARDLDRVRAGMTIRISASSGDPQTEVQIAYVAPAGEADSQSVIARAVIDNPDGRWVPGQFVTGEIVTSEVKAPVAIVPEALQTLNGKTVVFLQNANGFEAREISIGRQSPTAVEVTKGLRGGERYASANSYVIKSDLTKGEAEAD